ADATRGEGDAVDGCEHAAADGERDAPLGGVAQELGAAEMPIGAELAHGTSRSREGSGAGLPLSPLLRIGGARRITRARNRPVVASACPHDLDLHLVDAAAQDPDRR